MSTENEWAQLDAWAAEQLRDKTPEWFTPSRHTKGQNHFAAIGRHPMGLPLANNGHKCGDCAHLERRSYAGTYLKCGLVKNTGGPATDIRAKWAACEKWADKTTNQEAEHDD